MQKCAKCKLLFIPSSYFLFNVKGRIWFVWSQRTYPTYLHCASNLHDYTLCTVLHAYVQLCFDLQLLLLRMWEHCKCSFFFYSLLCLCRWLHLTGSILPPNVWREVVLEQVTADLPQLLLVGLIPVTCRDEMRKYHIIQPYAWVGPR